MPANSVAVSAAVDDFASRNEDVLVLFAVANTSATGRVLAPENAKNCLAVAGSGRPLVSAVAPPLTVYRRR